jgi:AcrR family transcriptional regulator
MESRTKLLEAAARVYAESGFRGATTRRIAEEAGVNEVTIFRHFGSKAALIDEAVRSHTISPTGEQPVLPQLPVDPERELTAWCAAHLAHLRSSRAFIRKTMGELEERPEAAPCAANPTMCAAAELKQYMIRLYAAGFVHRREGGRGEGGRNELAHAAGAMLMGALFADAMGRDMMPDMYPQPADRAPALYVRLFLAAIGAADPAAPAKRSPNGGRRGARRSHPSSTNSRR